MHAQGRSPLAAPDNAILTTAERIVTDVACVAAFCLCDFYSGDEVHVYVYACNESARACLLFCVRCTQKLNAGIISGLAEM